MTTISVPVSTLKIVHRVSVVHGGTGRPWDEFEAELLDPVWPRWRLRKSDAMVVLSTLDRFVDREPAQTTLAIRLTRADLSERFAGGGVTTVTLDKGDGPRTLALDPVPVQLRVTLLRSNGTPSTHRTVEARSVGHTVSLPAAPAGSNVYESAPTVWAAKPYRIFVNDQQRGFASLDYRHQVTSVRVTEP